MTRTQYNESVKMYADGLYRFVFSNIHDSMQAEDVVQDTFTKFWEKHDTVAWEKCKSYLFTTAYHTMIDGIRKSQRMTELTGHEFDSQCTYNKYPDLNDILHQALQKLNEIQRTVVLLRDYEGYSYDEIGEITGLTEAQVKVYIFRARTALKKQLQSVDNLIDVI